MWARVDDGWWCHAKVMGLSLAARGVWVSALSWSCAQRSATVPVGFLPMIGADLAHAEEIAAAGLWVSNGEGWEIHDWAEYQDLSTSERRAEAGRKGGKRSGEARRSKAKQTPGLTSGNVEANRSDGEANAEAGTHPVPSRPDPSPAHISPQPPVVDPEPSLDAERIEQMTNRAVGLLANLRAIGGDNPGALARHIGENLPAHERSEMRDLIASGMDPRDAAAALADPLRGLDAPARPGIDPAAVQAADELAKRREQSTADRLAAQRAVTPAAPPADLKAGLRAGEVRAEGGPA